MEFRKEFSVKPLARSIHLQSPILLIGSCFTENLGQKLSGSRFKVMINPNGILFNPFSICRSLEAYVENRIDTDVIFSNQDWWNSWDHHSVFNHQDKGMLIRMIQDATHHAHTFLKTAEWLVITLGSAWVYVLPDGKVVANCHKVPADKFSKQLMKPYVLKQLLAETIQKIVTVNPNIQILCTISPVRHLRDGFIENNRSKAVLIQAVHELTEELEQVHYFPAYELVIDDLRDYRFYAEDLAHPNYQATDYVWQKFTQACLDRKTKEWLPKIHAVNLARAHRPLHPFSTSHQNFRQKQLAHILQLQDEYPFIDWSDDIAFFTDQ